jgi:hypothetical protein
LLVDLGDAEDDSRAGGKLDDRLMKLGTLRVARRRKAASRQSA